MPQAAVVKRHLSLKNFDFDNAVDVDANERLFVL